MRDSLVENKALFLLLVIFVIRFSLFSGSQTLLDQASLVFKIELLLILLYTLVNKKLPSLTIVNNPSLLYGALAWLVVFVAKYAVHIYDGGPANYLGYIYSAFHAIFFVYAVDITNKMRIYEDAGNKLFFVTAKNRQDIMLGVLCVLTFSIALTSGESAFTNANIVLNHEVIFICAYVFIIKSAPSFFGFFRERPIISLLLVIWFLAVTISFLFSPYDLTTKELGVRRYYQTFFHAAFFIFAYQFFVDLNKNNNIVMLMLPLSVAFLSLLFVMSWFNSSVIYDTDWFFDPPLNSHIRHTGYIATASTGIAIAFMLHQYKGGKQAILYFLLLLISSTLLFWTGGRAAAISGIGVLVLLTAYLAYARSLRFSRLMITCLTLVLAAYLSEVFKVFEWNGLISQLTRSEESIGNVHVFMSERPRVWMSVIESLQGNWFFGLGPQGYFYMPNRILGVQPHNMFLQFVAEWGLFGATLFITLLLGALVGIINSVKDRSRVATVGFMSGVAVLIALTIHGLVSGTYFHGQPSYYLALAFAACLSAISGKRCLQAPVK